MHGASYPAPAARRCSGSLNSLLIIIIITIESRFLLLWIVSRRKKSMYKPTLDRHCFNDVFCSAGTEKLYEKTIRQFVNTVKERGAKHSVLECRLIYIINLLSSRISDLIKN